MYIYIVVELDVTTIPPRSADLRSTRFVFLWSHLDQVEKLWQDLLMLIVKFHPSCTYYLFVPFIDRRSQQYTTVLPTTNTANVRGGM